jgi:dimethylargininase
VLTALTHTPSPQLNGCALTYLTPRPIDVERAIGQHREYCAMLRRCSAHVLTLAQNAGMPDSVFVEDTAVVLDAVAIITPMGVTSREKETEAVASALAPFRPVARIAPPAALEGGDVLRIGKRLYVGLSARTNRQGIAALDHIAGPHGYRVTPVAVQGCLHLKTGCTALDDETILINPDWVDPEPFTNFKTLVVPGEEPFGANILQVNGKICMHSGFAQTRRMLERLGYATEVADISEFLKAEAGMTCMSIIFKG